MLVSQYRIVAVWAELLLFGLVGSSMTSRSAETCRRTERDDRRTNYKQGLINVILKTRRHSACTVHFLGKVNFLSERYTDGVLTHPKPSRDIFSASIIPRVSLSLLLLT